MNKTPIAITLDTHERKSAVLLHGNPFFTITHALLKNDDIEHIREDGRKVLIEVKIGNDITDIPRFKQEITRMAEVDAELHFIFIEDNYVEPATPPFHKWIALSECQKNGVFFHRRVLKDHFPAVVKAICEGVYTRRTVNVALPLTDIKTNKIPYLAKVLLLIEGVTLETAMKVYECIKTMSQREPTMTDLMRECLDAKYSFPAWIDNVLGKLGGFDQIDTDLKMANYNKLEEWEKIERYRKVICTRIIHTFHPDVLDKELEVKS